MSTSVDERVVQMKFDNKNFEKNVQESIDSLEKLKGSLDFDKSEKSVASLQKSFNNFDSSGLSTDISKIANRFSALGIMGDQVLRRLADSFYNVGLKAKNFVASITVDQVTAGWDKYINKTTSIQTIMNATGASVEEVNDVLEQLQWFSDETSFSFTDMAAALGQMTSAGGDMKKLVPMIMGIANATAFAGKGPAEFSRAIYNLNQSYGTGSLKYMDWKSLEMAGVNSKQLKQTLIDTAVELGRIEEGQVNLSNFNESLKDDWADQSVMERAFGRFAEVTQKAYEMVTAPGSKYDTASDAYDALAGKYDEIYYRAARAAQEAKTFQEAIDATKDAVSSGWMKSFELIFGNYFEAKDLWTSVANSFWDIFAQSAESRNELLEEWHNLTVGGYTDFAEALSTLLDGIYQAKNALSDIVYSILPDIDTPHLAKAVTAFKSFSENFRVFFTGVNPVDFDISAIMEENGLSTKHAALELINQNSELKEAFEKHSAFDVIIEKGNRFKEGFAGVISVINSLRKILVTVWNTFSPLLKIFGGIGSFLTDIFASFGRVAKYIDQFIHSGNGLRKVVDRFATTVSNKFKKAGNTIYSFFERTIKWDEEQQKFILTGEAIDKVRQKWEELKQSQVGANFTKFFDSIKPVFGYIEKALDWIGQQITKLMPHAVNGLMTIVEWLSVAAAWLADIFNSIKDWFNNNEWFSKIRDWFKSIKKEDVVNTIGGVFTFLEGVFQELKPYIQPVIDQLKTFWDLITAGNFEGFKNLLQGLLAGGGLLTIFKVGNSASGAFKSFGQIGDDISGLLGRFTGQKDTGKTIFQIAVALGILAISLAALSKLNTDQIVNSTFALGTIMFIISGFLKVMKSMAGSDILKPYPKSSILEALFGKSSFLLSGATPLQKAVKAITGLGIAMMIFALAMRVMSKIPNLDKTIISIGELLFLLAGFLAVISKLQRKGASVGDGLTVIGKRLGAFSKGINAVGIGLGMTLLAGSLLLLAAGIALFMKYKPDELKKAGLILLAFVSTIGVVGIIGEGLGDGFLKICTGLLAGSAALLIAIPAIMATANALKLLAEIPNDKGQLAGAVISLSIALAALAAAAHFMKLGGALSLLVAASAIGILSKALSGLSVVPWEVFLPAIGQFVIAVGAVAGACWLLDKTHAANILKGLTVSVKRLGFAMLGISAGLLILKLLGPEFVDELLNTLTTTFPKVLLTLGELLWMTIDWFDGQAEPLTIALCGLIESVIDGLDKSIDSLIEKLVEFLAHLIQSLATSISSNANPLAEAIIGLLQSIIDVVVELIATLTDKLVGVGNPFSEWLRKIIDNAHNGSGMINTPDAFQWGILGRLSAEMDNPDSVSVVNKAVDNAMAGKNFSSNVEKIIEGLNSNNKTIRDASLKAITDLQKFAAEHRGTTSEAIVARHQGETITKYVDWNNLDAAVNNANVKAAITKAMLANREYAEKQAKNEANKATDTVKEEVVRSSEEVADTAETEGKKINLGAAKSILSTMGIPVDAVNETNLGVISALLNGGASIMDIVGAIATDAEGGFYIDPNKLSVDALAAVEGYGFGFEEGTGWLQSTVENVVDEAVKDPIEEVKDTAYDDGNETGNNFVIGLINGLQKERIRLGLVASEVGDIIKYRTMATLQVQSPSKVAEEIGGFWDLGLINGLKKYTDRVASASTATANSIINSFSDAATTASSLMSGDFSNSLTVTPIMDLKNRMAITHLSSVMENQNRRAQFMDPRKVAERPGFGGGGPATTKNYGGFTINVSTQPGQNPKEIAKYVMEEIQYEIDKKEAALA